jgi:DNA-binding SARP family transcriptional activator/tetratricopeptide (TPR) repeat protein
MKFLLLGEVQLHAGAELLDVGTPRQQAVLAALAVDAGRPVAIETLIERVWNDTPPVEARSVLYSHLSRIRQLLQRVTRLTGEVARIERRSAGYVLDVDPDVVDLRRFTRLAEEGTNPRGAGEDRAAALTEALSLWRGPPLAGLSGAWADQVRDRWHRRRLDAAVRWGELELILGRADMVISTLPDLVAEYPLAEPLEDLLMRALHAAGRDAEAIERYAVVRQRLADELGTDPGVVLRTLHSAILRGELPPDRGLANGEPAAAPSPVPRQLPAQTPRFVGRAEQLQRLAAFLDEPTHSGGGTVVITAIDGTAGVGKTALALHWAHHVALRFPDGQLYVNLRGFDPTNNPVCPTEVLHGFLHALGVPPERIPTTMDAQAALYRSLAADRRLLVVLDNARDAEQVRSLLPAGRACCVVVTSRNELTDLTVQHGARTITLDVLTPDEARALLARHLGDDRTSADPVAVTELIELCARLPLALAIVAARAIAHPGFALRELANELSDERTRLAGLDTGTANTSVGTVFSWSYNHLSDAAARMFRLLGLHPGPDIALPAAARLADLDHAQARAALGELGRARLVAQHTHGRYICHDLLRAYAVSLAATHDSHDDQTSATNRLFDHYLHTTASALRTLHPEGRLWPDTRQLVMPAASVTDVTTARAWFDTERANLTAIITNTAAHRRRTHTARLAHMLLLRCVESGDIYSDSLAVYAHALDADQYTGDRTAKAYALTYTGMSHWKQGRYQQAIEHQHNALAIFRDLGHRVGEALGLSCLGIAYWRQGHLRLAAEQYQHALTISRDNDIRVAEVIALSYFAHLQLQQGEFQFATEGCQRAVSISRQIEFQLGEALALAPLGIVNCAQGRFRQATEHHERALAITRDIGDRLSEALALNHLGVVQRQQGRYRLAIEYHQQTQAICGAIGFVLGEAMALNNVGLVHHQQGRHRQAIEHHQQALTMCRQISDRAIAPRLLNDLGNACHASGHLDQARIHHAAALDLATELGDPNEQARAHRGLADISTRPSWFTA